MLTPTLLTWQGYYFWKDVVFWNNFFNILVKTKLSSNIKHYVFIFTVFTPSSYRYSGQWKQKLILRLWALVFPPCNISQGSSAVHRSVFGARGSSGARHKDLAVDAKFCSPSNHLKSKLRLISAQIPRISFETNLKVMGQDQGGRTERSIRSGYNTCTFKMSGVYSGQPLWDSKRPLKQTLEMWQN